MSSPMKASWRNSALPVHGLPPSIYPANARLDWFSTDSRENFERLKHPIYGDRDIEYAFNSLGYRSARFDRPDGLRILAIGCSYVFGIGLPSAALFQSRVGAWLSSRLSRAVTVWNLGLPGTSNDYVARMLHLAVPVLDPHVVLVNFTHSDRREYVSVQGEIMPYCPGWHPRDPVGRAIKSGLEALSSACDDEVNLYRNYKSVEALLSTRLWLFSTIAHPLQGANDSELQWGCFATLREHVDPLHFAGVLRPVDLARDGSHPGPASHQALAEGCCDRLRAIGGVERLAGIAH